MNKTAYNETILLQQVANGEEPAFRHLFDTYRQQVYGLGLLLTRSDFFAEELVQDVFLRIWISRARLAEVTHFKAYLKTITRNTAIDHLRRMAAEKLAFREMNDQSALPTTTNEAIVREYEALLRSAIDALPPQRRKAYLLSRQAGLKNEEIARQMDISLYTVKEHLKLANRQIRAFMERGINTLVLMVLLLCFQ